MSLAGSTFGVPEPGNSPLDEPGHLENGDVTLTSPELILVAGDEEAQRARDALTEVVPTDERILAEVKARSLRVAPAAVAAPAAPSPAPIPAAPPPPPPPPVPVAEAAPVPAAPPSRRRSRLLLAAALVPIAALGLAFGVGWNPFGGSDALLTTAAAPATPGRIGTATSALPATTSQAPPASTDAAASTPAHTRARTTTPTRPATHPGAGSPTTGSARSASTPRTATTKPANTSRPTRSATTKPAPPPVIQPSHVFAWPAAPDASFYLVRFMHDGKKVFEKRVTEPRLTLPGSFRFTAGNYRWVVLPATGSAGNPQYAPAIIDSKFVVA
ncbi:MAG TPA: hypothetical protein VLK36_01935 [Gaiellaceae bacterium]|nr:hypothetical protein [Gaiellaceae bacterium]